MPFNSRAYRVLIASPSDVEEEREIAVRVIQEWNDLHAYTREVVLLPLRWETHSAPEHGTRPQEAINKAIVDQCDLLVGIFWTRIGTPTGLSESGTLEEIARVAEAGKPIMLYFSRVGMDPDKIDIDQLNKLNDFKLATYPNSLMEFYKSHIEFRDKFSRQLELRVRELQKRDVAGGLPPLQLSIATSDLKSVEKGAADRVVSALEVSNLETATGSNPVETDHIHDIVDAYVSKVATTPVVLAITNTGAVGVRNLYVEINISNSSDMDISDKVPNPSSELYSMAWASDYWNRGVDLELSEVEWGRGPDLREGFKKTESGWRLTFEWAALQPNRRRFVSPVIFVRARKNGSVTFRAKIYADSLPEPVSLESKLNVSVRKKKMDVLEFFSVPKVVEVQLPRK